MGLSKQAIEDFKKIYRKEFKEDISDGKAQELGENLISLFRVIYRPIPNDIKTNVMHLKQKALAEYQGFLFFTAWDIIVKRLLNE